MGTAQFVCVGCAALLLNKRCGCHSLYGLLAHCCYISVVYMQVALDISAIRS
eukprot:COSAG01_NODE_542_length_15693_cov_13.246253_3_plen_52_part_00